MILSEKFLPPAAIGKIAGSTRLALHVPSDRDVHHEPLAIMDVAKQKIVRALCRSAGRVGKM